MMRSEPCSWNSCSKSMTLSARQVRESRASGARSMTTGTPVLAPTWVAGCGFATRAVSQAPGFTSFNTWKR